MALEGRYYLLPFYREVKLWPKVRQVVGGRGNPVAWLSPSTRCPGELCACRALAGLSGSQLIWVPPAICLDETYPWDLLDFIHPLALPFLPSPTPSPTAWAETWLCTQGWRQSSLGQSFVKRPTLRLYLSVFGVCYLKGGQSVASE